ncbi:S-protein-like protein 5-like [Senna tora]|uniref:S-protein homolog n=1 Tax=Senna tora TaxID=362788 RepID=A0A834W5P8_9FABA|nr:S-protein-like protein 5-like [Senna tora]
MAPSTKSLILPLLLLTMAFSSILFKGSEAIYPFDKVVVEIFNDLASKEDLTLHCKAKHDDRGEHTIKSGESYRFKFYPNPVLLVSLYFCSFRWQSDQKLHYINIYMQKRDSFRWQSDQKLHHINIYSEKRDGCLWCGWTVKERGPCTYDFDTKTFDICYGWLPSLESALAASNVTNANSTIEFHV